MVIIYDVPSSFPTPLPTLPSIWIILPSSKDLSKHKIIIATSDNQELADEIKKIVIQKFGENLEIETMPIGPVIGSHCGPDAVGVCFYAKHR